jgi:Uncharacterized conserved protein (DUF2190)
MHEENHSMKAGADLSACCYHIVRVSNALLGQVNIASEAVHSSMIGILRNKPAAAGRSATISLYGEGTVAAGAAIGSIGVFVTCNGSGRAIAAASGDMVVARALETATADGQHIRCLQFIHQARCARCSGGPCQTQCTRRWQPSILDASSA